MLCLFVLVGVAVEVVVVVLKTGSPPPLPEIAAKAWTIAETLERPFSYSQSMVPAAQPSFPAWAMQAARVEKSIQPLDAWYLAEGLPITILSNETPASEWISKTEDFGKTLEDVQRRPLQVPYSMSLEHKKQLHVRVSERWVTGQIGKLTPGCRIAHCTNLSGHQRLR